MKKKFLALVMTLSMVLSLVPMTALATEGGSTEQPLMTAENQAAGEGAGNQDSSSTTGGNKNTTGGEDSTNTPDTNTNTNNKDEGKDSGSENTDGTTGPSKPDEGTTEGGENTPIAVPTEELIFDKDKGVIKGIKETWLAKYKDNPLSVTIPEEINDTPVTSIGRYAFEAKNAGLENHPQVAAVDFSKATNLEKIDNQAFQYSPVTSVDLSNTKVTTIGKFAFGECTSLETFIFPDTLTSLGNSDGASVFKDCKSLKIMRLANSPEGVVFALPKTLTYIGKDTFRNCFADGVEAKVVIPASVATLGEGAFYDKHITQIIFTKTVDLWKDEDYSGYDSSAITPPNECDRIIVLPDNKCFVAYSEQVGYGSKLQKICTYPIKITFSSLGIQEQHLNHALLDWTYNSTTKLWDSNNSYKLPDTNGATTGSDRPGYEYVGGWKLRSSNQVLNENEKLEAKDNPSDFATVSGEYKLANPTISYLVDGKTEDVNAAQPFTVTIGDKEEHSIGILVDHPLLKEKKGTDEDYVYFEYYWFDEVALENGSNTLNGPRSTEESERFSTATSNVDIKYVDGKHNTIPITKVGHARYEGSSYTGYNDYYLVVVFGYHVVNGDKINTPFYLSANNGIGVGNANATDGPHLLQVKVNEVRIITATAGANGTISPSGEVEVPKGEDKTFTITPNDGYHIQDVKVDEKSVGAVKEYTFKDVTEPHTIHATFARNSSGGSHKPTVTIPDDVPTGLNGKDHYAYVVGYPDGMVYPQKNITRAEVATIFFRLLEDETREANMTKSNGYNDMKDGAWYTCAVSTLSKMGIIKGYEDGSFKPDASISRAEFAAIAARFDPDGDKTPATFSDVSSHWAKDEISIAANHGWIKGYEDGSFKPDQKITRAETMTLVNRVLNRLPETKDDLHKDMKTWVDNMDETAWYYLAVQEATNSHYFKNKTGTKFEQWTDLRDTRDWSELEK